METQKFSIGEAIGYGFRAFIDHFILLVGAVIIAAGIYLLAKFAWILFLAKVIFSNSSTTIINTFTWGKINVEVFKTISPLFFIMYALGSLLFLLIYDGLLAGMIQLLFNVHDKNIGSMSDLFSRFYLAPRILATGIVYILIVTGGLILLVIPGIYWALRFSLFPYFIVDTGTGIMDALRNSYRATAHHTWKLFGILFILYLLNFIPLVGSTIQGLVAPLVLVYVYRKLTVHSPIAMQTQQL